MFSVESPMILSSILGGWKGMTWNDSCMADELVNRAASEKIGLVRSKGKGLIYRMIGTLTSLELFMFYIK